MQGGSDTPGATPGTSGENVRQVGPFVSPEQANLDGAGMGLTTAARTSVFFLRASWCADGDLVCDLPISGELSQLVIGTVERLDLDDPEHPCAQSEILSALPYNWAVSMILKTARFPLARVALKHKQSALKAMAR